MGYPRADLQAAAATVDLNPVRDVPLGCAQGVEGRGKIHDGVEANLLALFLGDSAPLLLVSVDALYVGPRLETIICAALDLPRQNVFIAASHTHSAPMLDPSKPALGTPDQAHLQLICDRISDAARELMAPGARVPAILSANSVRAHHSISRRLRRKRRELGRNTVEMLPSPRGSKDEMLTTLTVNQANGKPIAVVWNYACHPVAHPFPGAVSAQFPGVVRRRIRGVRGGLPVLFFQGFSGDTRPNFLVGLPSVSLVAWHLVHRRALAPLQWKRATVRDYMRWSDSLSRVVERSLSKSESFDVSFLSARRTEVRGSQFAYPDLRPVSFQALSLGDWFGIVGVSAEPVSAYGRVARFLAAKKWTMCVGCTDTPFGYAPTSTMLAEGGYEAGRFCESFGLEEVSHDVEQAMVAGFESVTGS